MDQPLPEFVSINGGRGRLIERVFPSRAISGIAGTVKSVKKLCNDIVLVEVEKAHHVRSLLQTTMLGTFPVKVEPHHTLNISKGVMGC